MKQLSLIPKPDPVCDGTHNGKRKEARTTATKNAMHVILKIEPQKAVVSLRDHQEAISLFDHREEIRQLLHTHAEKFSVKIYTWSIQKDHIHILARFPFRECYIKFIRTQTGLLARTFKVKFSKRPFTRIVQWGRDFWNVNDYIFQNEMEVFGFWKYQVRGRK